MCSKPQTSEPPCCTGKDTVIQTDIPVRLDRLPWSRFHWLLVAALGVTWVLDGLEATFVASISPVLERSTTLGLRAGQIGLAGTLYLGGAISGALIFGYLADRLGRKRLFTVTLLLYLTGAVLTAFAWDFWSFVLFRCLTGMAIGGEYSAINSAIDELIPARVRGRVDLAVNGSFWLGAMLGAAISMPLLNVRLVPQWLGWRLGFALGAVVGGAMIVARRYVPESPRWLLTHGRVDEAEKIMQEIESHAADPTDLPSVNQNIAIHRQSEIGFGTILYTMFVRYRSRAVLGLVLIASQAFFYNGITFTYPLVLSQYFEVPPDRTGSYVLVMAMANFLGPLLLGHLFDSVGRRTMISSTYAFSGAVIIGTEFLFLRGQLTALSQTLLWAGAFFFASTAASAGYLTVSETFPLEIRALAIALFYALGTALGGLGAPALFGKLLETNRPEALFYGYLAGGALMIAAAVVEVLLGVASERKALEDIALPLAAAEPGAASSC